jgi:hypothetical protein
MHVRRGLDDDRGPTGQSGPLARPETTPTSGRESPANCTARRRALVSRNVREALGGRELISGGDRGDPVLEVSIGEESFPNDFATL